MSAIVTSHYPRDNILHFFSEALLYSSTSCDADVAGIFRSVLVVIIIVVITVVVAIGNIYVVVVVVDNISFCFELVVVRNEVFLFLFFCSLAYLVCLLLSSFCTICDGNLRRKI